MSRNWKIVKIMDKEQLYSFMIQRVREMLTYWKYIIQRLWLKLYYF